jgi:hypothetical protein
MKGEFIMNTYAVVEMAVKLVVDNLEANGIMSDTNSIRNRVLSWYNHSDIVDAEILAGCALMGRDWFPGATYQYMIDAKKWWFPQDPYNEISIWEIEAAQHDAIWR